MTVNDARVEAYSMSTPPVFSNRIAEIESVDHFLAKQDRPFSTDILILKAERSSGVTRFIDRVAHMHAMRISAYKIDAQFGDFSPISSRFAETAQTTYASEWSKFSVKRNFADRILVGISIAVSFIPLIGSGLAQLIDRIFAPKIVNIADATDAEKLRKLLRRQSNSSPPCVFVDNAQHLRLTDIDYFRSLALDDAVNVKIVLAHIDDPVVGKKLTIDDVSKRLRAIGVELDEINFHRPDAKFAAELCECNGKPGLTSKAQGVAHRTSGDIYEIVSVLREVEKDIVQETPESAIADKIISYLCAAESPLERTDIIQLAIHDDTIACSRAEIDAAIVILEQDELVCRASTTAGRQALQLHSNSAPSVMRAMLDKRTMLLAREQVYRYFLNKPNSTIQSQYIAYKCAKTVDPLRVPERAQSLVKATLRQADADLAREFFTTEFAIGEVTSFDDFVIAVAARIALKRYQEAVSLIKEAPIDAWRSRRIIQTLNVVALNRVREHEESVLLADQLLPDSNVAEERSMLASFKISGLLHEGRRSDAEQVFVEFQSGLKSSENYGYFLRNASSALPDSAAIDVLKQAQRRFRKESDEFGYWTSEVGIGSRMAEQGNLTGALSKFEAAKDGLLPFGIHHMEETFGNIAFTQMLLGQFEKARVGFAHLLAFAADNVPKMFALSHLAFLAQQAGDNGNCAKYIAEAEEAILHCGVPAHRARSWSNLAYICALQEEYVRAVELLERAQNTPTQPNKERIDRLDHERQNGFSGITGGAEGLKTFYSNRFFEYWSQEPIAIVSRLLLSAQT